MTTAYLVVRGVHIAAGTVGLLSGAAALLVAKGYPRHRLIGLVFVTAMCTMATAGIVLASVFSANRGNVMGGLLTLYLVVSGWLTGWRPAERVGRAEVGAFLLGIGTASVGLVSGLTAMRATPQRLDGYPPTLYFVFGTVALFASVFDARMLRRGGIKGAPRLARHLTRLIGALFIATASFFLGQAKFFPASLRSSGVLQIPVWLVVLTLAVWLWRIRLRTAVRRYAERRPVDGVA